jgi:NADH dehydrogenase
MRSPQRILILGGSGFVGRSLLEQLVRRNGGGSGVLRVPSRRPARAAHLRHLPTVELVAADVNQPQAWPRLLQGVDAVVNLVAILHGSVAAFERAHVTLPEQLVSACRAAGVRRVVHVSALGVGPGAPSNYLRSKTSGEAVLNASGLDVTILRPSVIFGANDRFLNLFADLQTLAPFVPLAGAAARFQPVWVEDVAAAIVHALDNPQTIGQTMECAGPDVLTLADLVRAAGVWSGHPRPVWSIPGWMGQAQAALMQCLPGEPLMSLDNLRSMQVPNVATGTLPGLAAWGIQPTSCAMVMGPWLGQRGRPGALDAARARSRRA